MRGLPAGAHLTTPSLASVPGKTAWTVPWLDKEKPCGEQSRTILPGQDWELEIRKAVREMAI